MSRSSTLKSGSPASKEQIRRSPEEGGRPDIVGTQLHLGYPHARNRFRMKALDDRRGAPTWNAQAIENFPPLRLDAVNECLWRIQNDEGNPIRSRTAAHGGTGDEHERG